MQVAFALVVEASGPGLVVAGGHLRNAENELRRADRLWGRYSRPLAPLRDTWGAEDDESIEAYRAAERLAGGPAPPRPKESD